MNPIRKGLAIAVIVLFLVMSIPSTGVNVEKSSIASFDVKTLYVGGDGPGNYTKIQDAIDNASDGDTVFVYNGTYFENLLVNKSIKLLGEDRNITIIDGDNHGNVIKMEYVNLVTITGFTIQNGGNDDFLWDSAIWIFFSENVNISNNILKDNGFLGVLVYWSSFCNIYNNIIQNNSIGIKTWGFKNSVKNNIINENRHGIEELGANTSIVKNKITKNIVGITIFKGCNTTISYNDVKQNSANGILIHLSISSWVFFNNIQENDGIGVYIIGSDYSVIKQNNIYKNKKNGFFYNLIGRKMVSKDFRIIGLTNWENNYWGTDNKNYYLIFGRIGFILVYQFYKPFIPWINFDWHPTKEPYDI